MKNSSVQKEKLLEQLRQEIWQYYFVQKHSYEKTVQHFMERYKGVFGRPTIRKIYNEWRDLVEAQRAILLTGDTKRVVAASSGYAHAEGAPPPPPSVFSTNVPEGAPPLIVDIRKTDIPGTSPAETPEPDPIDVLRDKLDANVVKKQEQRKARAELFTTDMLSVIKSIPVPQVQYRAPVYKDAYDCEEIGLMISDVHIGEKVTPEETQGLSEYGVEIFMEEMATLKRALESILPRQLERTPCPVLNIFFLGDIITGKTIFRGQLGHVDLDIGKQVFKCVDEFGKLLAMLARYNNWQVCCWCAPGNHGRVGMKDELGAGDNLDYIAYHFLAERLRDFRNVHVVAPDSYTMLVEVQKHMFVCNHGHAVRGWAGVPYYGFDRASGRFSVMYGQHGIHPDYWLAGHFHEVETTASRIINGSWVGGSDLSVNQLQKASEPAQVLFGVHEKRGVVWQRPLKLRQASANAPVVFRAHDIMLAQREEEINREKGMKGA